MELVDQAHRSELAQAAAQVLVIARGEQPATVLAESARCLGLGIGEAVTDVDGQQPQLVVAELVDVAQDGVVVGPG